MKSIKNAKIIFSNFFCAHKALILLICFALFLRIAFFVAVKPYSEQILQNKILEADDAREYHDLAIGILENGSFSYFGAFRTPLYPVFLSIIYSIWGIKPWMVLFIQIFLSAGSLIMVYLWAKIFFGKKISLISAALYAIDPHVIFYSVTLMPETLLVFIFLGSMLILTYGIKKKRLAFFLLSGFLLGLATLAKPIMQLFPLVAIIIVLIYPRIKWSFKFKAAICYIFMFALAVFPWLYRNYLEYRHLSLSYIQDTELLFRHAAFTEITKTSRPKEQVLAEFKKKAVENGFDEKRGNPFDNARICSNLAIDYLINNWKYYIPRYIKGIMNMFLNLHTKAISDYLGLGISSLPYEYFASPNIFKMIIGFLKVKSFHEVIIGMFIAVFLLIIYLAFIFGSFLMISEKQYFPLQMILIIMIYFSVLIGVIGLTRYKLPILPFYVVVSSKGIFEIFNFFRNKK